jgi:hypothetical protein
VNSSFSYPKFLSILKLLGYTPAEFISQTFWRCNVKRFLVIILALCLTAGLATAQDSAFQPLMEPGDFAVTAGVGYGFF